MIKKIFLISFIILIINNLIGVELRNTSSILFETYSYEGYSWHIDDTFIAKITNDVSILVNGFHSQRTDLSEIQSDIIYNLDGKLGAIINWGYFYSELSYKISGNLTDEIYHSIYFDLTHESANYLFSPSIQLKITNSEYIIAPSFGYTFYKYSQYKVGSKLFGSFSLGQSSNAAIWVWGGFYPDIPIGFRFGLSTGTLYSETNKTFDLELSILPSLDLYINEKTSLKYNFIYNINPQTYDTLSHELVFDIKL